MQVFYGILVQHFAILAGTAPLSMQALDVLTVHILELTAEVPYYAATVARARLTRAHKRLSAALTSLDSCEGGGWPGKYIHQTLQEVQQNQSWYDHHPAQASSM